MHTLLMTLLAFSMPLMGTWRITLEQDPNQAFHLIGDPDKGLIFYDDEWYPIQLRDLSFEGDRFHIETQISSGVHQAYTFDGVIKDGTLQGKSTVHILQHSLPGSFSGLQVNAKPLASPVDTLPRYRKDDVFDLVSLLKNEAPTGSFDEFRLFWEKEIEPHFYPFLNKSLYGYRNSPSHRTERLQKLFSEVSTYSSESVKAALQSAEKQKKNASMHIEAIVLLPETLISESQVMSVASKFNEEYCCDQPLYWKEQFLVMPVR